jgi:hypothetical protein
LFCNPPYGLGSLLALSGRHSSYFQKKKCIFLDEIKYGAVSIPQAQHPQICFDTVGQGIAAEMVFWGVSAEA